MVELRPPGFLDLVHHYLLLVSDPEQHDRLNRELIGSLASTGRVDPVAGFAPPSWWRGDEYASRSGVVAAVSMRG